MMTKYILPLCFAGLSMAASAQELYVKELVFPAEADSAMKIEMAGRVVGNPQQQAWQQRELTAFLHFGMNTFTDREWGDGKESPELFNPSDLDTDQWVKVLKDAGFEMVILTAKHHDGFCLWPTKTTSHSVASSPWREGKGDIVGDLRRSCDKYGMKLGIYLSPWDRNAECYGDSERYNDLFVAQLTELLTNYGKIDEVWFDGACGEGPNGKKQVYDWLRFRETMRRLQPEAVLAITGDDVRWVGNEGGRGRTTEWSTTPLVPSIYSYADSVNGSLGIDAMSEEIGSRATIAKADRLYWWPSEVDVSIRPGWFYHATEKPHSLARLKKIYLESVGRNSVLLLNIPPDTRGLIAEADVDRLNELHQWIEKSFNENRIGDCGKPFNTIVLEEAIEKGQRVEEFEIVAHSPKDKVTIAEGTTIGKKRIITLPSMVFCDSLSLEIKSSRGPADARIEGVYYVNLDEEQKEATSTDPILTNDDCEMTSYNLIRGKTDQLNLIFTLKDLVKLKGVRYVPKPGENARIYRYEIKVTTDGTKWETVAKGEFGNIEANPITQTVLFNKPIEAKQLMFKATEIIPQGKSTLPDISELQLLCE